jgi:hypothetical protein
MLVRHRSIETDRHRRCVSIQLFFYSMVPKNMWICQNLDIDFLHNYVYYNFEFRDGKKMCKSIKNWRSVLSLSLFLIK